MRTYKLIILGTMAAWMTACENANPEYDATGVFETTEVIVSAQGNGEIMQLTIEEGSEVSPNELLGHIDTIQLSLKRQQLTATLSATESRKLDVNKQLASIRQQIANLKTEQLRYEKLVKANAASQKQLDDINYNLEVLHKQLSATLEQIGSSNSSLSGQSAGIAAQVAQIDKQIEDCLITSPIKGIILSKYAEQGEFAIPGRALFKVGNISDIKLRAYVSAPQLTSLQIGQKVKVYADFGETDCKEYEGTVTWISAEAEFTPKTIQTRDERSNLV